MADKSCYMGAGGYGSGYMGGASNTGYAREEYAYGSSGSSNNQQQQSNNASSGGSGGGSNPPGVFKARTDQSCYLGPNPPDCIMVYSLRSRTAAEKPPRQEMATFPLKQLPSDLLLLVLKNLKLKELVRLRKTEKFLDNFVEDNRRHIKARVDDDTYLFIEPDSSIGQVFCHLQKLPKWMTWMQFGINTPNKLSNEARSLASQTGHISNTFELMNPYAQLSAVKLPLVVLGLDEWTDLCPDQQGRTYDNCVIPLLEQLQLNCEQLQIDGIKENVNARLNTVLENIRFSKVSLAATEISKSDFTNLKLENCSELYIETIKVMPQNLKEFFGNARTVSLTISCVGAEALLYSFLEEVKLSQSARGTVEELIFKCQSRNTRNIREFLKNSLEAQLIFEGNVRYFFEHGLGAPQEAQFFKVTIDEGFAIIHTFDKRPGWYRMHFIEKYSKNAVIEILNPYLSEEQMKKFIRSHKFTTSRKRKLF